MREATTPRPSYSTPSSWKDRVRTFRRGGEAARIEALLSLPPGGSLLDVGGGTGAFTARFAPGTARVVVLEPDEAARRAGARQRPGYRFVAGHGERLPFDDGSFDSITAIRSTHHMASPAEFLQEAHRVLRVGGVLLLEELSPGSWVGKLFGAVFRHRHHAALDLRGSGDWEAALRSAGFVAVRGSAERRWYFVEGRKPGDPARSAATGGGPPAPTAPPGVDRPAP